MNFCHFQRAFIEANKTKFFLEGDSPTLIKIRGEILFFLKKFISFIWFSITLLHKHKTQ